MRKLDFIISKVFLYELLIVIIYLISIVIYDLETVAQSNSYARAWYDFGGCYIFGSWMIVSIYLSIRLMSSGLFREKVLTKLTFIKERDEREVILTGKAAKTTMLTTIAILIFLFCLSCFQFSTYRVPPDSDGKSMVLSLNLNLDLLKEVPRTNSDEVINKEDIISYTGLPISSSAVILGLIIWQIISYNYHMRRLM